MLKKFSKLAFIFLILNSSAFAVDDITDLDPAKQDEFRDVAGMLRCPTCTGLSVLGSDAPFSTQIKSLVKEQVVQGKSKDQILEYFTERYGPWILREPPKAGFNLVAWAFPALLLCLGPLLIWFLVWRRRVAFNTFGVRTNEEILAEFNQALSAFRVKEGK